MAKKNSTGKVGGARRVNLLKGVVLWDCILVKPFFIEEEGMIAKPQQYEDKHEFGEVILVGEGRLMDNGTVVPLKVKAGDTVLFQKYSAQKVRSEGTDYLIIREEDIYWIQ